MVSYKITVLTAAIVAMAPLATADLDSLVSIGTVVVARDSPSDSSDVYARQNQFNPDTYEDGKYKSTWTECKSELQKSKDSMNVTHLESDDALVAQNVPTVCMSLGNALSNHFSEANPLPMGNNMMKITNVTATTINHVHSAFGSHFHKHSGSSGAHNATKPPTKHTQGSE